MIKVCLDTNVFISALLFGGKPEEILRLAGRSEIIICTSPAILTEVAKVLKQKFRWSDYDIKKELAILTSISSIVTPKIRIQKIAHHPDNRILECAIEAKVDYIISGDKKHLLPLGNFKGIPIVSPAQFLRISRKKTLKN